MYLCILQEQKYECLFLCVDFHIECKEILLDSQMPRQLVPGRSLRIFCSWAFSASDQVLPYQLLRPHLLQPLGIYYLVLMSSMPCYQMQMDMLLDCEHCNSTRSSSRILEHQGTSSIFSAFFILYEYDPRNTRNTLNFSEETENYRTSGNSIRRFLRANKGNISFTFRRPSMYNDYR